MCYSPAKTVSKPLRGVKLPVAMADDRNVRYRIEEEPDSTSSWDRTQVGCLLGYL
jgi:hypothetical protein